MRRAIQLAIAAVASIAAIAWLANRDAVDATSTERYAPHTDAAEPARPALAVPLGARVRPPRAAVERGRIPTASTVTLEPCRHRIRVRGIESTGLDRARWWTFLAGADHAARVSSGAIESWPGAALTDLSIEAPPGACTLFDDRTGELFSLALTCGQEQDALIDVASAVTFPLTVTIVERGTDRVPAGVTLDLVRVADLRLPMLVPTDEHRPGIVRYTLAAGRYRAEVRDATGLRLSQELEIDGTEPDVVLEVAPASHGRVLVTFEDAEGKARDIDVDVARRIAWISDRGAADDGSTRLLHGISANPNRVRAVVATFPAGAQVGVDLARTKELRTAEPTEVIAHGGGTARLRVVLDP